MLNDTLDQLWLGKHDLEERARLLSQAGDLEAADELARAAYRLGNQLLEVDAVVQQYAEALNAAGEPEAGRMREAG